jgi:transposase-like protein
MRDTELYDGILGLTPPWEVEAVNHLLASLLLPREILESEITSALGAAKSERTEGRLGYRRAYDPRLLVTRVGTIELRVSQDRQGRFSTQLWWSGFMESINCTTNPAVSSMFAAPRREC